VALAFDEGNKGHDVSQNLEALLSSLTAPAGAPRALDVLDLGCAGGRDLLALAARGHRPVGLDGAPEFVALARAKGPFEVWEQDLCRLALPAARFDGVFANAVLFHVPSVHLDAALAQIWATLRPGGAFFCSNAHGFGEDKEGWTRGRTPGTRSWVCWLSEASWVRWARAHRRAAPPCTQSIPYPRRGLVLCF
jgi:SAM-dependent methyltransferase